MQLPSGRASPSTPRQESLPLRSAQHNALEVPAEEASNQSNAHGGNDNGHAASVAALASGELIQRAVCEGRAIVGLLEDSITQNALANNEETNLNRIVVLAEELRSFQSPVEFTIGLVGDSGSGKWIFITWSNGHQEY
jgi:hypothetical protein